MKDFAAEVHEPTSVLTGKVMLQGMLHAPAHASAIVLFGRATVGDRVRDEAIAAELQRHGVALLDVMLLTEDEQHADAKIAQIRHDADFLAQRMVDCAQWIDKNGPTGHLPMGVAGCSVAAAGAIIAAGQRPDLISVVVSINGRTDLAVDSLRKLRAPTLFVVNDMPVLRMNREALVHMKGEKRIEIIHGTDDEAVGAIVQKSSRWFSDKLVPAEVAALV